MGRFDLLKDLWKEVEHNGPSTIYSSDFLDTSSSKKINISISSQTFKKHFPLTSKQLLFNLAFNRGKLFRCLAADLGNIRALAGNAPLYNRLLSLSRGDDPRFIINAIAAQNCQYRCGFVPLDTGIYQAPLQSDFDDDTELCKAVLASTAMPMVWPPVASVKSSGTIHNDAVDGGIVNVTPLGDVINAINRDGDENQYVVVVINCNTGVSETSSSHNNIVQIGLRALSDISITEIFNNDLREFLNTNSMLCSLGVSEILYPHYEPGTASGVLKRRKHFRAIVISPHDSLGDVLNCSPELIRERRRKGWKRAKELFNYK
jgi:NTE family protein